MYHLFDFDAAETSTATVALAPTPYAGQISSLRDKSAYHRRLVEQLGRGSDWAYEGECNDLGAPVGKCACGHEAIRYEFTIHHPDGRTAILGSTCIETYPGISPEAVAAVERDLFRLEAEAKAREKRARELTQDQEIIALARQWSDSLYRLDEAIGNSGRRIAWKLWDAYRFRDGCRARLENRTPGTIHPKAKMKQYKSKAAAIRFLKSAIADTDAWAADPWEH